MVRVSDSGPRGLVFETRESHFKTVNRIFNGCIRIISSLELEFGALDTPNDISSDLK